MPAVEMPKLKPFGVVGVFIGGCVKRGDGSSFRRKAHAHCYTGYPYRGWICIRSPKRVYTDGTGQLSTLVWHEVGHIWRRSWTQKQVEAWARKMVKRGG